MARSSPARTWSPPSTKPGTGSGSSLRAACFETHRSSFPKDSISPSRTSTSRNCSRRSACGATTASGNSPSACPPGSGRAVALLGCLVGGSLTAYYLWNAHQQELARQAALLEEQRRLAELAEKNAQAKQPLDLASLQKPWTLMPDLEDMLRACSKATGVLSLSIQGWLFESSKCDGRVLVATYHRTGNSTAADLTAASQHLFADRPAFVIDNGNTAALKVDLKVAIGSDEPLQPADDALQALTSHLYRQGVEPKLSISQETTPPLPGAEAAREQQVVLPSWKKFTFSAQTRLPADLTFQGLPAAGVRITNLETTLKDSQLDWTVTGEIYAN
ncbi:type 4b pilus protein PilO2 [Pseudomonas aeruginosa]